jgi:hypothetical protein
MKFRRFIISGSCGFLGLVLIGCAGPVNFWYKPGVPPNSSNTALLQCRLAGANAVPISTQFDRTPQYRTPITTNCFNTGSSVQCTQSGGQLIGGEVYSYDANAGLRNDYTVHCMNSQGFYNLSLRRCRERDVKGGIPRYSVLPILNSNA